MATEYATPMELDVIVPATSTTKPPTVQLAFRPHTIFPKNASNAFRTITATPFAHV